jgi:hypothetical protein
MQLAWSVDVMALSCMWRGTTKLLVMSAIIV